MPCCLPLLFSLLPNALERRGIRIEHLAEPNALQHRTSSILTDVQPPRSSLADANSSMRSMRERNDAAAEQVGPKPREAGRHNCIVLSRLFVVLYRRATT
jgi:hypothetical protein